MSPFLVRKLPRGLQHQGVRCRPLVVRTSVGPLHTGGNPAHPASRPFLPGKAPRAPRYLGLGFRVATGTIISSGEIPPWRKEFLYRFWYSLSLVGYTKK